MSIWNFGNLSAEADQANVKQVEVREGTYNWRIDEILDVKTQAGDQKYQVKMTIVSAEDGSTDLIGTSRNQHFVVGHKKQEVAASYKKDLSIDQCIESTFSVKMDIWRDNAFAMSDAVAVNLNKVMVAHLENVTQKGIAFLNSNDGTNVYTNGGSWTVDASGTLIPAAQWDSTAIFGALVRAAKKNKFNNPYLISGENLDQLFFMSQTSAMNGEGKGDANRIAQMRAYFDLFNVDDVNDPDLVTYVMNRGAVAFLSKGYYGNAPQVLDGNMTRFSVPNRFFPQLIHDVEKYNGCVGGVWSEHYKVITRFDFELNPLGCTAARTGIMRLIKEAGI